MLLLLLLLLSWQVRATKNSFQSEVTKERRKLTRCRTKIRRQPEERKERIRKKKSERKEIERKEVKKKTY